MDPWIRIDKKKAGLLNSAFFTFPKLRKTFKVVLEGQSRFFFSGLHLSAVVCKASARSHMQRWKKLYYSNAPMRTYTHVESIINQLDIKKNNLYA